MFAVESSCKHAVGGICQLSPFFSCDEDFMQAAEYHFLSVHVADEDCSKNVLRFGASGKIGWNTRGSSIFTPYCSCTNPKLLNHEYDLASIAQGRNSSLIKCLAAG
jgi:hypothetical protein